MIEDHISRGINEGEHKSKSVTSNIKRVFKPISKRCSKCKVALFVMTPSQEFVTCSNCNNEFTISSTLSRGIKLVERGKP